MSTTKTKKSTAAKATKAAKAKPAKAKTPKAAAPATSAKAKKAKADGKMSALDAAAKVLADSGEPMNCKAMIEEMAAKGLWTSPGEATRTQLFIRPSHARSTRRARKRGS